MVMRVRAVRRRSWGSVWGLEYCGVLVAPRAEGEWGEGRHTAGVFRASQTTEHREKRCVSRYSDVNALYARKRKKCGRFRYPTQLFVHGQ